MGQVLLPQVTLTLFYVSGSEIPQTWQGLEQTFNRPQLFIFFLNSLLAF